MQYDDNTFRVFFRFSAFLLSLLLFISFLFVTNIQLSSISNNTVFSNNSSATPVPKKPLFSDTTLQTGIDFVHFQGDKTITGLNEIIGTGSCVIDYDGDGWQDLFVVGGSGQTRFFGKTHWWQTSTSSKLYKNMANGTFLDVTINTGLKKQYWGMGCTTGDLDNDGDPEIFVTTFSRNYLYRNNGDNTFSDISQISGIQGNAWSTSVSFADYNNDGLLDIYVVNYLTFDKTLRTLESRSGFNTGENQFLNAANFDSATNVLYQNMGGLIFKNVTQFAQVGDESGRGLSAMWADLNNDQHQDLIISNGNNSPNAVYLNQKNGTFVNASNRLKFSNLNGSNGISIADLNNDSFNDIVTSGGIGKLPKIHLSQTNNNAEQLNHHYIDQAYSFLQKPHSLTPMENWTIGLHDFNNDGFIDVFFTHGLKTPDIDAPKITVGQKNLLKLNHAGRQLLKADAHHPFSKTLLSSRGAVFFDFDHDGDIDIFVTNNNDMARFYRNDSPALGNWVQLQLIASNGPLDAIGAKVWLKSDGLNQFKEITSGSGFLSNSSYRLHFGLGNDDKILELKIQWPNGGIQFMELPSINRFYLIKEGVQAANTLALSMQPLQKKLSLTIGEKNAVNRSLYLEILWNIKSELFYKEAEIALRDPHPQVRLTAITLLATEKDKKALKLLLQKLDDTDIQNLIAVIKAVSRYEDEQSITWLLRLLLHPNRHVKMAAIEQFAHFFNQEEAAVHRKFLAVPSLIHLLSDRTIDVKLAAIKALGLSESYRAAAPLLKLLEDQSPDVQATAANSLGHIRERKAIDALFKLADDNLTPGSVRAQALFALKRIGYDAEELALSLLAKTNILDDSSNNLELIYYLLTDHIDGIVLNRKHISKSFKNWLVKNTNQLKTKTNNIDARTAFFLINLIASQNPKIHRRYFSDFFQHKNTTVRLYAYLAQIEYGNKKNDSMLLQALSNEAMSIRKEILHALGDAESSIDIPADTLEKLLSNKENTIDLIHYYGKVFNHNAGVLLTKIAADDNQDSHIRLAALAALINKPYPNESLPKYLLTHKNKDIRHLAIKYWSLLQPDEKKWLRKKPMFIDYLEETHDYLGIIEAFRNRPETWAKQAMIKIISQNQIPFVIRQQAVVALARSGNTHHVDIFSTLLKNSNELLLQAFLKQAIFNFEDQQDILLKEVFFNTRLLPTTRLLAAQHLKNPSVNLSKLLTQQNNEATANETR